MNAMRFVTASVLVVAVVYGIRAEDKKADAKLVGSWEVVKTEAKNGPPVGAVVEFSKDGKMKVTHKQDGKDVTCTGTYSMSGDKINVTLKCGDMEVKHLATMKKLTDTELVCVHEDGKQIEFKRKK